MNREAYLLLRKFVIEAIKDSSLPVSFDYTDHFSKVFNRKVTVDEAVILMLVSVPHVMPDFFDGIFQELYPNGLALPQMF